MEKTKQFQVRKTTGRSDWHLESFATLKQAQDYAKTMSHPDEDPGHGTLIYSPDGSLLEFYHRGSASVGLELMMWMATHTPGSNFTIAEVRR